MPVPRARAAAILHEWLSTAWPDLISMAVVGAAALAIYYAPIKSTRTFPITFDGSGDIVFPQYAYPDRGWLLPAPQAGALSIGLPILIYLVANLVHLRSVWDAGNATLGTTWAALLGSLFQVVLKQLVGGFRPYFLAVCMPDPFRANNATDHNSSSSSGSGSGSGFHHLMYTTDICTQPSARALKNATTAFPSGHATAAFAGCGFLFLWTHAKLKVWANHRPSFWKLAVALLPLLAAATMAGVLTVDAAHSWGDIAAGAAIGSGCALAAYRASYAAVWDWRYNHIPLRPGVPFAFGQEEDDEAELVAGTIAQTAGWGSAAAAARKKSWLPQDDEVVPSGSGPRFGLASRP